MYGCESWIIKKAECRGIDAFELWCWKRLLRVPWTARRSNQSILKEISPGCSLEELRLKLKLQYFGHLMPRADSFEKTLMLGKIKGRRRRGRQRMSGWMASSTQWTWVWVDSGNQWWRGRPGVLLFMGSQRVRHGWATELNWYVYQRLHFCRQTGILQRTTGKNSQVMVTSSANMTISRIRDIFKVISYQQLWKRNGFMKGQLSFQYSYAFKFTRKASICTVLLQSFGFSLLPPRCFTDIIFTRNRFYLVVLPVQLFFKSFWLLTLDQSQCLFMHVPAQQDVNKNAFHAQVGSSPLHNCPRARWSGDLAFSLNVSETLNPVIHPLGKDSQMLFLHIHFDSNLAVPNGT